VVYLDNPRGTGFSTADAGALCTDWTCYGADFDAFLRQFVAGFAMQENDVYVTGESYGGHYVPASAYTVMTNNAAGVLPYIKLAGVAIGNGFVAPYEMVGGYADIIYNAGLLSPAEYDTAKAYVAAILAALDKDDYRGAYLEWDAFLNGDSTPGGAWFTNVTGLTNYFNIATETPPDFAYFVSYVTSPAVRAALGVGAAPFNDGNLAVEIALINDVLFSQKPRVEALLAAGLKVLIYNGALDLICGAPLTERYTASMVWPGAAGFAAAPKALWHDTAYPGGAIAGYARTYANFVNVVMRGAGHMAPFDQPSRSLDLITRFVRGAAFD
jgi:vitellogenic carboxypeptidase-like protein